MDGFLNIDKPDGITSAQVVRDIKQAIKPKKIGYIGTLDPIAKGVLVMALGRATKLIPFLERQDKVYDTVMTLGAQTDTQDRTGTVVHEADPSAITGEMVKQAATKYVGEIEQTPPMYSAKKVGGKRLYSLARQGKEVERKPVHATVYSLDVLEKNGPNIRFVAKVSTGTYMRTICNDIGNDLGVYGHLSALTRISSGLFKVEDAIPLDEIDHDTARKNLISLVDGLNHLSKAVVLSHARERLVNGQPLGVSDVVDFENMKGARLTRIVSKEGSLLGVGELGGPPIAGFPFGTINPKRVMI